MISRADLRLRVRCAWRTVVGPVINGHQHPQPFPKKDQSDESANACAARGIFASG
jgi:hypothetical protein